MLELRELVDANIVEAAKHQQHHHSNEAGAKLRIRQEVLLNNPSKGKLDPRWTGLWVMTGLKGPSTEL